MSFDKMLGSINVSASGMRAERLRMEVVANNIANASATRTPEGGPFRRKEVIFATMLAEQDQLHVHDRIHDQLQARLKRSPMSPTAYSEQLGGVSVLGIVDDATEMPRVYNPGHPDAEVRIINAGDTEFEVGSLIQISRVKEANKLLADNGGTQATFDPTGFVTMPNVNLPIEMINLITATRSYEAGVRSIRSFREMSEQALSLAPPTRG